MIVNSGGNTTINQHSDSNATDKILRDTSKCEFIVVCDNMMTPTCVMPIFFFRTSLALKPTTRLPRRL